MDAPLGPFRERATAEGGQDESGQQRAGSACVAREVSESGTRESTFIVSERKRLRMAPEAIASKKAIGAWSSRRSRVACSTREARSEQARKAASSPTTGGKRNLCKLWVYDLGAIGVHDCTFGRESRFWE